MSIKKTMLLASMAAAAIAFAAPASALAEPTLTWTDTHVHVTSSELKPFEGRIEFTTPVSETVTASFGCETTITVEVISATTNKFGEFTPTTGTCGGGGPLTGCKLVHHTSNVEEWVGHINTAGHIVLTAPETLTIHNEYEAGTCAVPTITTSHMEFQEVTLTPTLDASKTIDALHLIAKTKNGALTTHGSFAPEGATKTLGLT